MDRKEGVFIDLDSVVVVLVRAVLLDGFVKNLLNLGKQIVILKEGAQAIAVLALKE